MKFPQIQQFYNNFVVAKTNFVTGNKAYNLIKYNFFSYSCYKIILNIYIYINNTI